MPATYGGSRVSVVIRKTKRKRKREQLRVRNRRLLRQRQQRILKRLVHLPEPERDQPMIAAGNIHYELGERVAGLAAGGIGAMLRLAHKTGLVGALGKAPPKLCLPVRVLSNCGNLP